MGTRPARSSVAAYRAVRPAALVAEFAGVCLTASTEGHALRVLVDGADVAEPAAWGTAVAVALRAAGRPCAVVAMADWLRPASLRLEQGHHHVDSFRDHWFDYSALRREVLDPLGPGGSGQWLPTLWDASADRATRAVRRTATPGMVLLVAGPMLLGRSLACELTAHLHLSEAALRRRSPPELRWTVPALMEHEQNANSDTVADLVVRADHPDRPAAAFRNQVSPSR